MKNKILISVFCGILYIMPFKTYAQSYTLNIIKTDSTSIGLDVNQHTTIVFQGDEMLYKNESRTISLPITDVTKVFYTNGTNSNINSTISNNTSLRLNDSELYIISDNKDLLRVYSLDGVCLKTFFLESGKEYSIDLFSFGSTLLIVKFGNQTYKFHTK